MRGPCLSLRDHTCSLKHSFPVLLFAEVTATVVGVMWRAVGRNPGGAWSNPLRYLVKFPAVLGQISCGRADFRSEVLQVRYDPCSGLLGKLTLLDRHI